MGQREDHLQFSYDGEALSIPEGLYSEWTSPENNLKVERIASKNSATVTLSEAVEISVNVIPVTEEDNRIHNYRYLPTTVSPLGTKAGVANAYCGWGGRSTGLVPFSRQTASRACSLPATM
ncbi:hypothetical protein CK203_014234 [Vitis vinifera]|uniref:Uncharacterized protein n=1 Tax=Vitis vinifera TaxID=29760 RepID=A0A438JHV8_VITVI|nr:hypothetical protein CK203_014234 [Vitis vinifera]